MKFLIFFISLSLATEALSSEIQTFSVSVQSMNPENGKGSPDYVISKHGDTLFLKGGEAGLLAQWLPPVVSAENTSAVAQAERNLVIHSRSYLLDFYCRLGDFDSQGGFEAYPAEEVECRVSFARVRSLDESLLYYFGELQKLAEREKICTEKGVEAEFCLVDEELMTKNSFNFEELFTQSLPADGVRQMPSHTKVSFSGGNVHELYNSLPQESRSIELTDGQGQSAKLTCESSSRCFFEFLSE